MGAGPACVGDELFVAASPDFVDDGKQFARAYSRANRRVWELAVSRIVAAVDLPRSRVALVSSPTIERWEKYREFHPVEDECRVTVVDRDGAVARTHVAGAPLASLVAHAGGLVFVVKQGSLIALAAE